MHKKYDICDIRSFLYSCIIKNCVMVVYSIIRMIVNAKKTFKRENKIRGESMT